MKNKKYIKKFLLLYLTFFISILLIPNLKVKAETINPAEWIKNNWLNYPNDTGQWTTNSINGNPALGSTKNVNWTGYLNTFAMDTKDAVFEFKMYQNENADDDNMGWTFRHNYINSPTDYKNHSFYAFVTNGGWSDANGNIPSGLYKKSYGKNIGWNPNHGMTALKTFDFNRAPKTLYNVKIEVKDEIGGTRIKIWIDEKEVVNYLDIEPILSGGYGPFSFSQAHAYFYDMNINGSSVYNIPPSISVTSPAQNQQFLSTDKISLVGSANDVDNRGTLSTYYQFDDKTQQLIWTKEQNGSPQPFNLSLSIPSDIKYGNHTLTVWAKDSENAESQKQVINFFVKDINRPNVTHSIVNGTNNTKTININATDSESGVKRIKLPNGTYVNGDTASYSVSNKNADYTFVVEDNAGNTTNYMVAISDVGVLPVLKATPNHKEDYINLNWSINDTWQDYIYRIFKKEQYETEYQSIPAKETATVLNIHPNKGDIETFTNWKGNTFSLPKSASLKRWMEEPNQENSRGYGKGLISVDTVTLNDFNNNPNKYLKNANETWKYDVVFIGSWDCNGSCTLDGDISEQASVDLENFIKDGRGFLAGHDVIHPNHANVNKLRSYINVKIGDIDIPTVGNTGTTSPAGPIGIEIQRKGFLTNYPWNIGDVGTKLTIPKTHTSSQYAYGDVWMKFSDEPDKFTIDGGVSNFYLTTWNNAALIQTGHSKGQATEDEQKLLANTLFYLSQLSSDTNWDDRTGQDVTGPTVPNIKNVIGDGKSSTVKIEFTPSEDRGTTYNYYIEATGKRNDIKTNSNIETVTITSGLKGYSIVIDDKPNTIPDNKIETTNTSYSVSKAISGKFYVHVAAIDNVGNVSEVSHYQYNDSFSPSMTLTPNTINWTNKDVTIIAEANDNESGVKRIKLPNGNYINSDKATFTVSSNNTYEFVAEDYVGNTFAKSIVVQNIDKVKPTVSHTILSELENGIYFEKAAIKITSSDSQSGVKRIKLPDGIYVNGSTATYDITTNGNHTFLVEDNAGNINTYIVSLSNIGYKPILTVNPKEIENNISLNWEMKDKSQSYNYNVFRQKDVDISFNSIKTTINTSLIDEGGKDVNMPTKPMVTNYSLKNGIVTLSYNGSVDKGTNYKYYIEATGQNYPIKTTSDIKETNIISGLKGYSYIIDTNPNTIPDNTIETVNGNNINFTLTNKTMYFHIKAVDNVGNSSETVHFKVEDNENPILNITGIPTEWTKEDILLSISASDELSGIKSIILPNGNVINSDKVTYLTDKNGNLTFKAIDNVGNITTKTITIDKIDKIGPELTYKKEISSSKLSGFINISLNDTMSGVDYLVLPDNTKVYNVSNYKYPINNNGIYYFMAYDKLGNGSSLSISVDELLTNINPSGISKIEYKLEGATVQNWTVYNSPFVITNEGITIIRVRAYDKAGNLSDEKVSTAKIDKTKPINNSIIIKLK